MTLFGNQPKITKFIWVTRDWSCLGFAKMMLDRSDSRGNPREPSDGVEVLVALIPKEDEDSLDSFHKVGEGIVDTVMFDEWWGNRADYRDWAIMFDYNHNSDKADILRSEGFSVFGTSELTDRLEHDRAFGTAIVKKAGLSVPETHEFDDIREALDMLDENPEMAFVFKPDDPDSKSWVTTCPENDIDHKANREMRQFLASQDGQGTFLLQERKKGVELCLEFFVYRGKPFFCHANFELKKKYEHEMGKMIGCAGDIEFVVPTDCRLARETLSKLVALPEFSDYTGMVDMNMIVADNEYYFLEFCCRFGFNATPTLFLGLAVSPADEIFSDFITGDVQDFGRHFRTGFGASVTAWIDDPVMGLPIMFDDEQDIESRFYHFDTYKEGNDYFLAGYANETGIVVAHDYDLKSAADEAIRKFWKVHYPCKSGRLDLNRSDYANNPIERYVACQSMRLFEKGNS